MPTVRQVQRTSRPDSLFAIRAQQLLTDGKSLQALELCRQGLIYYPDNPTGYAMLAYSYLALGDSDRACNVLIDGFRRTGAHPLRNLYRRIQQPSPIIRVQDDLAVGIPGELNLVGVLDTLVCSPPSIDDAGEIKGRVEDVVIDDVEIVEDDAVDVGEIAFEDVDDAEIAEADTVDVGEIALKDVVLEGGIIEADEVGVEEMEVEDSKSIEVEDVEVIGAEGGDVEGIEAKDVTVEELRAEDGTMKDIFRETLGPLALHVGGQNFRTRSSNLRLIPGLEFAPLRQEETAVGRQSIASLMSEAMPEPMLPPRTHESAKTEDPQTVPMPLLDGFEIMEMGRPVSLSEALGRLSEVGLTIPFGGVIDDDTVAIEEPKLTPLEKLARQLENARIPAVEEASEQHGVFEPSIVSDTFANILVDQEAYAEAIKAFQMLARHKPERVDYYQARIQEMKEHLQNKLLEEGEEDTSD